MIKSRFAITTHIMTLLANNPNEWLSSGYMAGSLNVNPVLIRKELVALKARNLIESKEGKNGGVRLLKSATDIKLSEIFEIARGEGNVLEYSKNKANPQCPIGKNINNNLEKIYKEMDNAIELTLSKITLEEFKNQF